MIYYVINEEEVIVIVDVVDVEGRVKVVVRLKKL